MTVPVLCFGAFDPVTGPPTTDGNTGIEDLLVYEFDAPDPGYTKGGQATLSSGGAGGGAGSGVPAVIVRSVLDGSLLRLAFFCRFDPSFNDEDAVVIALRKTFNDGPAPTQTTCRRIDIFPVWKVAGAPTPDGITGGADDQNEDGSPAGTPDTFDVPPNPPPPPNTPHFHVRANHAPRDVRFYAGQDNAIEPWTKTGPVTGGTFTPGAFDCKVRSWVGHPNANGDDRAWSVEVVFPVNRALGGQDWLDLDGKFGIYLNVIRAGALAGVPTTHGLFATEYTFSNGPAALTGELDTTMVIPHDAYAMGVIPGMPGVSPSDCGVGIQFVTDPSTNPNGEFSVGARQVPIGNPGPGTGPPGHQIVAPGSPVQKDNVLVAQVKNTDSSVTPQITAEFRIADWGLTPTGAADWKIAPGSAPAQPRAVPGDGSTVEIFSLWPKSAVPPSYAAAPHQCMWIQLLSADATPVTFVQSSVRRNMDFLTMSSVRRRATVSGSGYPKPPVGTHHELLLVITTRTQQVTRGRATREGLDRAPQVPLMQAAGQLGQEPGPSYDQAILTIIHGYRRTGQAIVIDGTSCEILDDSPGAFGYAATHFGAGDELAWDIRGRGLTQRGPGVYTLTVPDGGRVILDTTVAARPPGSGNGDGDSWRDLLLWLLALLRRLLRWLKRLLRRNGP
jgi:hypothetical protein